MAALTKSKSIRDALVEDLSKRVNAPAALDEPFILQDRIAQTRTRHVVVIWNRWSSMNRIERSKVILDAYQHAGILGMDSITVALGLTEQEALQTGYLPYSIVTTHRSSDSVSLRNLKQVMETTGGVRARAGSTLQLRFPTLELAQEAYRDLQKQISGPYWAIQQDVAASDSR